MPHCVAMSQVGNENFQYALQQLPDLAVLWTTSTDLAATNTTLPGYQRGVPTNLLFDAATVVRHWHNKETVQSSTWSAFNSAACSSRCMQCGVPCRPTSPSPPTPGASTWLL